MTSHRNMSPTQPLPDTQTPSERRLAEAPTWAEFEDAIRAAQVHDATEREKNRAWYIRLREDPRRWAARKAKLRRRKR